MFTLVKGEDVLADTAKVYRICSDQKPKVISTLKVKSFKSNIFRQSFGVKKIARQAGQRAYARGFNYTSKSVRQKEVWPYPGNFKILKQLIIYLTLHSSWNLSFICDISSLLGSSLWLSNFTGRFKVVIMTLTRSKYRKISIRNFEKCLKFDKILKL